MIVSAKASWLIPKWDLQIIVWRNYLSYIFSGSTNYKVRLPLRMFDWVCPAAGSNLCPETNHFGVSRVCQVTGPDVSSDSPKSYQGSHVRYLSLICFRRSNRYGLRINFPSYAQVLHPINPGCFPCCLAGPHCWRFAHSTRYYTRDYIFLTGKISDMNYFCSFLIVLLQVTFPWKECAWDVYWKRYFGGKHPLRGGCV